MKTKIKVEDIKSLREETGAGVADCRQALEEAGGKLTRAREVLRQRGLELASKKADRQVKAGWVFAYVHHNGRVGAVLSLACETDFVAKTDDFQRLGKELVMQVAAMKPARVEELLDQDYVRDPQKKIGGLIRETIGKLGENIQVLGFSVLTV